MLVLLGIGFAAGVITAVSPCVLPVLPVVLAGGASSSVPRRPFAIVAGLVASFTLFTLTAATLLSALGLPGDLLRDLAIAMLFVLAASLVFPQVGYLLERPLAFMTRRRRAISAAASCSASASVSSSCRVQARCSRRSASWPRRSGSASTPCC